MDYEFEAPSRFGPNRPVYKPEHWAKVNQLDKDGNAQDPAFKCLPQGVPRSNGSYGRSNAAVTGTGSSATAHAARVSGIRWG